MTVLRGIRLQHLSVLSWCLILVGAISLLAGLAREDGELWQLTGIMLLLAGGVKVIVILLWRVLAGLETDRHRPIPPS
jgi:hypothetical protein